MSLLTSHADCFLQIIQLPRTCDNLHAAVKKELVEVCAAHCHLRSEYVAANHLHERLILLADDFGKEKDKISEKLSVSTGHLDKLLVMAVDDMRKMMIGPDSPMGASSM